MYLMTKRWLPAVGYSGPLDASVVSVAPRTEEVGALRAEPDLPVLAGPQEPAGEGADEVADVPHIAAQGSEGQESGGAMPRWMRP